MERNSVLAAEICDSTGDLTALFYGRSNIPGVMCGSRVRFRGTVGMKDGAPVMINPAYELLVPYTSSPPAEQAEDGPNAAWRVPPPFYTAGKRSSYAGLVMTGWPSGRRPTEPRNRTRAPHTMPGMCERP